MFNPETRLFTITVQVVFDESDLDNSPATVNAMARKLADMAREEALRQINAAILDYKRNKQ